MEWVFHFGGQGFVEKAFDATQQCAVLSTAERNRVAVHARARGAADTMHVSLRLHREVIINHVRNVIDIEAACGDVRGDEHLKASTVEAIQRACASGLRFVAVNGRAKDAGFF